MTALSFWILLCDPRAVQCSVQARAAEEDVAHWIAEAIARESPGRCVHVTLRGEVEAVYGTCEDFED